MRPKNEAKSGVESEVGRIRLEDLLDHKHPLYQLSEAIDWNSLSSEFEVYYSEETGRPALSSRLLIALHYLKYLFEESDESVVEKFVENPYWQYFCGCEYFEHELPCHPTTLVKWRHRVGVEGMERLLKETVQAARREQFLRSSDLKRMTVDTTVQEKAIAFPTDARLYHKARRSLVREAKREGIDLRQSYTRLSKRALFWQSRYARARQMKRARRETRLLRRYLGCVIRDITRKLSASNEKLEQLLELSQRIYSQKRDDSGKLYSVHAPEVECIAKGKAAKRYEFGCKVPLVTTTRGNWVVGVDAVHNNPYDGHILKPALEQAERITDHRPEEVFVDQGFKGSENHPEDVRVHISGYKKLSRSLKSWLKRRSAIEPVIGHLKSDHGLERNHLLGQIGDRINAMLTGCGFNLRKLWRCFKERRIKALNSTSPQTQTV